MPPIRAAASRRMVLACVNSSRSIGRQESSRLLPVFYASIAKPGLRVCHLPRVKSGPSTGALPQAIDTSDAGNRVVGGSSGGRSGGRPGGCLGTPGRGHRPAVSGRATRIPWQDRFPRSGVSPRLNHMLNSGENQSVRDKHDLPRPLQTAAG